MRGSMTALKIIASFVEGKMSTIDFESELAHNGELESLLEGVPPPRYAYRHVNTYYFLIESDLSNPFVLSGVKTHLKCILDENGIHCTLDDSETFEKEIIGKIDLNWVDVPHSYIQAIIREGVYSDKSELIKYVKEKIKSDYVCLKKKPAWIQSPDWQYHNGKPMVFAAQIDLCDLFHDKSNLYVFIDKDDGTATCVTQKM